MNFKKLKRTVRCGRVILISRNVTNMNLMVIVLIIKSLGYNAASRVILGNHFSEFEVCLFA